MRTLLSILLVASLVLLPITSSREATPRVLEEGASEGSGWFRVEVTLDEHDIVTLQVESVATGSAVDSIRYDLAGWKARSVGYSDASAWDGVLIELGDAAPVQFDRRTEVNYDGTMTTRWHLQLGPSDPGVHRVMAYFAGDFASHAWRLSGTDGVASSSASGDGVFFFDADDFAGTRAEARAGQPWAVPGASVGDAGAGAHIGGQLGLHFAQPFEADFFLAQETAACVADRIVGCAAPVDRIGWTSPHGARTESNSRITIEHGSAGHHVFDVQNVGITPATMEGGCIGDSGCTGALVAMPRVLLTGVDAAAWPW